MGELNINPNANKLKIVFFMISPFYNKLVAKRAKSWREANGKERASICLMSGEAQIINSGDDIESEVEFFLKISVS